MNAGLFIALFARRFRAVWLLLFLLPWAGPVAATDNYAYRDGEYAIISGGRSPDGRWSIAAHGNGPYGDESFGLHLMREPAHKKRASLSTEPHLDTGPLSIVGLWAPDSRHVAILFRSDRHILELQLFAVAEGKVQSMDVPSLVDTVGHWRKGAHYELSSRYYRVEWRSSERLSVEEFTLFDAAQPIFDAGAKTYVTVDRMGEQRVFSEFSAQATIEITKTGKLHLLDLKPQPHVPRNIVYSRHLLFDPHGGLHNTETSLSSLAAPKN